MPGIPGAPGGPLVSVDTSAGDPGRPDAPITVLPGSPGGPCNQSQTSSIFLPWKFGPSFSSRVGRSLI